MQRTDIRTINVGLPDDELKEVQSLAEQAIRILGYTGYRKGLDGQVLDRVIQESQIPVLNDRDVARYKKEKIDEVIREKHPLWIRYHKYRPLLLTLIFMGFTIAAIAFFWVTLLNSDEHMLEVAVGVLCGALFTTISSFAVLPKPQYVWRLQNISGYSGEIPEFAITPALLIKQQLPAARIYVEELAEITDPFIVVEFMGKKRSIAAYDERKFEHNL